MCAQKGLTNKVMEQDWTVRQLADELQWWRSWWASLHGGGNHTWQGSSFIGAVKAEVNPRMQYIEPVIEETAVARATGRGRRAIGAGQRGGARLREPLQGSLPRESGPGNVHERRLHTLLRWSFDHPSSKKLRKCSSHQF